MSNEKKTCFNDIPVGNMFTYSGEYKYVKLSDTRIVNNNGDAWESADDPTTPSCIDLGRFTGFTIPEGAIDEGKPASEGKPFWEYPAGVWLVCKDLNSEDKFICTIAIRDQIEGMYDDMSGTVCQGEINSDYGECYKSCHPVPADFVPPFEIVVKGEQHDKSYTDGYDFGVANTKKIYGVPANAVDSDGQWVAKDSGKVVMSEEERLESYNAGYDNGMREGYEKGRNHNQDTKRLDYILKPKHVSHIIVYVKKGLCNVTETYKTDGVYVSSRQDIDRLMGEDGELDTPDVIPLSHREDAIFEQTVKFKLSELPEWSPYINLDDFDFCDEITITPERDKAVRELVDYYNTSPMKDATSHYSMVDLKARKLFQAVQAHLKGGG